MATYKLIQDIEAEDKILGPLTLRQFIFFLIAAFLFYICYLMAFRYQVPFLLVLFLPPALFFAFFAFPFGRDQPTEIWFLAKLRYWFKPRRRIWNQSGVKELVTITAPKKPEPVLTNGLSQTEVRSRLRALADTIDTRGWAVKNVNVNSYTMPAPLAVADSDRLVDPASLPQEVSDLAITPSDDILDETSNPIAQQFDSMIHESAEAHRQELVSRLQSDSASQPPGPQNDYWFMSGTPANQATTLAAPQAAAIDAADEAAVVEQLKSQAHAHPKPYGNLRTVKPTGHTPPALTDEPVLPPAMPAPTDPAILSLADNNDLNVSTLAREAKRAKGEDDGEVIVPLR